MERTMDKLDSAARFLKNSPNMIRRSVPMDSDEDEEHLIVGVSGASDDELTEINALKNIDRGENLGPDSFRSKMKKKMTTAIGKLSVGGEGRREQLTSEGKKNASSPTADREMARRSPLLTRLKKGTIPSVQVTDSAEENHFQFGSVNNSMEDLDDVDGDSETSEKQTSPAIDMATKTGSSQRPNPEGDDTTELGPGQVCPAQGIETTSFGELKLGVVMTKGQLEVHIMSAKRLPLGANGQVPDTYVKTYLTDSTRKRTQKKKTNIVKSSVEPMYRQKTKYSACNVYRRQIVASVWEKSAVFDKNQSIGEVTINLDDLDLSALKPSWYRLFKYDASAADSDSDN